MIDYEIFHKWWEYFKVIWWGICPPNDIVLLNRDIVKKGDIQKTYKELFSTLSSNEQKEKLNSIQDFISLRYAEEEDRKKTIESKAHSLIGQTSIAVSFLLAAISLGTQQYQNYPVIIKVLIWISFLIIMINFVTAGLHARNATILKKGYAHIDIDDLLTFNIEQSLVDKVFINKYNSYLNDVKGTYLKFSHWFFKFGFLSTIVIAFLLPPLLMYSYQQKEETKYQPNNTIIFNGSGDNKEIPYLKDITHRDTLQVQDSSSMREHSAINRNKNEK